MKNDPKKREIIVGLFFKSREEQRLREIRKNRDRTEAERRAGMAATRAYQQEHKEKWQDSGQPD